MECCSQPLLHDSIVVEATIHNTEDEESSNLTLYKLGNSSEALSEVLSGLRDKSGN